MFFFLQLYKPATYETASLVRQMASRRRTSPEFSSWWRLLWLEKNRYFIILYQFYENFSRVFITYLSRHPVTATEQLTRHGSFTERQSFIVPFLFLPFINLIVFYGRTVFVLFVRFWFVIVPHRESVIGLSSPFPDAVSSCQPHPHPVEKGRTSSVL